jgi:hypothetical protein
MRGQNWPGLTVLLCSVVYLSRLVVFRPLSTRACSSSCLSRPMRGGRLRYLHGISIRRPWNWPRVAWTLIPSHQIRRISDFRMLVHNPVAAPKVCRKCCRLAMSDAMGLRKRTVPSYMMVCIRTGPTPIGWSTPYCIALPRSHCSGLMASMESIGERVSPYLSPPIILDQAPNEGHEVSPSLPET